MSAAFVLQKKTKKNAQKRATWGIVRNLSYFCNKIFEKTDKFLQTETAFYGRITTQNAKQMKTARVFAGKRLTERVLTLLPIIAVAWL